MGNRLPTHWTVWTQIHYRSLYSLKEIQKNVSVIEKKKRWSHQYFILIPTRLLFFPPSLFKSRTLTVPKIECSSHKSVSWVARPAGHHVSSSSVAQDLSSFHQNYTHVFRTPETQCSHGMKRKKIIHKESIQRKSCTWPLSFLLKKNKTEKKK